jgi:hypothetical protein
MQIALTGVHLFVTCTPVTARTACTDKNKVCSLSGYIFWGFTNYDYRERDNDRQIIFKCSYIALLILSYCDERESVFNFSYERKEE